MRLEILVIVIGALVFLGLYNAASGIFQRGVNVRERVDANPRVRRKKFFEGIHEKIAGWVRPLGEMIPRSPEDMSKQEHRIIQAGIRRRDSAVLFYGIQCGTAILLALGFVATGYLRHHVFLSIVLSVFFGALVPDIVLARLIANRKERIQLALPDALDLTVVCVEAGLGLDQALLRISQEIYLSHPDLSDELRLTNLEMNMGKGRVAALRNLGRRTNVDDLKALCAVLIQTDKFGTSVGQALRVYSESLRTKRRQRAEERATKLAVKMIPPLVMFIFPSMFVVIAGPAVITIVRDLLPRLTHR